MEAVPKKELGILVCTFSVGVLVYLFPEARKSSWGSV